MFTRPLFAAASLPPPPFYRVPTTPKSPGPSAPDLDDGWARPVDKTRTTLNPTRRTDRGVVGGGEGGVHAVEMSRRARGSVSSVDGYYREPTRSSANPSGHVRRRHGGVDTTFSVSRVGDFGGFNASAAAAAAVVAYYNPKRPNVVVPRRPTRRDFSRRPGAPCNPFIGTSVSRSVKCDPPRRVTQSSYVFDIFLVHSYG